MADIISNLDETKYHGMPELSKSALDKFHKSPLNYWHHYLNPDKPDFPSSKALDIGSAAHTLILEPEFWEERVVQSPDLNRRTKEGREAFTAFQMDNKGKLVLEKADYDLVLRMGNAVSQHDLAAGLLKDMEEAEASVFYEYEGVAMRSRFDGLISSKDIIIDLKTTDDVSPRMFNSSIGKWRYHIQAYLYSHGYHQVMGKWPSFIFIAVSKRSPHEVAVYELDDSWYEVAFHEALSDIEGFKKCKAMNKWPSVNNGALGTLYAPAYLRKTED